ncbi:MAG: glycosyltransferase family 2 protein [Deltaproteobacteria bacterium]|nr:glycosyltransferase family 2 protein [Deltaproteobacteria bacterium]
MKIAVFSVVYPGLEKYLPDFFNSLSNQTDVGFELFLINDGLEGLGGSLGKLPFPVRVKDSKDSPSALRKRGINWLMNEGIEAVVFADADDYFSENRVEIVKRLLLKNNLVYNELILFGEQLHSPLPMLTNFYKENEEITAKDLVSYNCLGLSNTSIRLDKIPEKIMEIPDNQIAFDWDFFSLILHSGISAFFTGKAKTWYRQHEKNIASPSSLKDEQILRGIHIKRDHYCLMSQWYEEYNDLEKEFRKLLTRLKTDDLMKKKYCNAVRKQFSHIQRWWEPMKLIDELIW